MILQRLSRAALHTANHTDIIQGYPFPCLIPHLLPDEQALLQICQCCFKVTLGIRKLSQIIQCPAFPLPITDLSGYHQTLLILLQSLFILPLHGVNFGDVIQYPGFSFSIACLTAYFQTLLAVIQACRYKPQAVRPLFIQQGVSGQARRALCLAPPYIVMGDTLQGFFAQTQVAGSILMNQGMA